MSICPTTGNINFNCFLKVVCARFLHCKMNPLVSTLIEISRLNQLL